MAPSRPSGSLVTRDIPGVFDNALLSWSEDFAAMTLLALAGYAPFGVGLLFLGYHVMHDPSHLVSGSIRVWSLVTMLGLLWMGYWRSVLLLYHARAIDSGVASIGGAIRQSARRLPVMLSAYAVGLAGWLLWWMGGFGPLILPLVATTTMAACTVNDGAFWREFSANFRRLAGEIPRAFRFLSMFCIVAVVLFLNAWMGLWTMVMLAKSFLNIDRSVLDAEWSMTNPLFILVAFVIAHFFNGLIWTLGCHYYYLDRSVRQSGLDLQRELAALKAAAEAAPAAEVIHGQG